jgi:hypothetical protein
MSARNTILFAEDGALWRVDVVLVGSTERGPCPSAGIASVLPREVRLTVVSGTGDAAGEGDRPDPWVEGREIHERLPLPGGRLLAHLRGLLSGLAETEEGQGSLSPAPPSGLPFGRCVFDPKACRLTLKDGSDVPVTPLELNLIQRFLERPNQVLRREDVQVRPAEPATGELSRSFDVRVARLRKKIEVNPAKPATIRTVRGRGYMYMPASR